MQTSSQHAALGFMVLPWTLYVPWPAYYDWRGEEALKARSMPVWDEAAGSIPQGQDAPLESKRCRRAPSSLAKWIRATVDGTDMLVRGGTVEGTVTFSMID